MTSWKSADDVLDFAIEREQESVDFYTELATNAARDYMRSVFEGFAREEAGHKARLGAIKEGKIVAPPAKKIADLKVGDYLVAEEPTADMGYQDALILAMKKEKAAFRLYSDLAAIADDEATRNVFATLAQEEAKHKLRFEVEYDDTILTEN
jgi:rubrerythrin